MSNNRKGIFCGAALAAAVVGVGSVPAFAENYGGVGIGYSEACRTNYQASFAGGDCIQPNLDVRGTYGWKPNEFFSLDANLDLAFGAGHIGNAILYAIFNDGSDTDTYGDYDNVETNRYTIGTFSINALGYLPVTSGFRFFAGPTLAGSFANFDYDVKYFGNSAAYDNSTTTWSGNYGFAAGFDVMGDGSNFVRVQWQNLRHLKAEVDENRVFSTNTLSINFFSAF